MSDVVEKGERWAPYQPPPKRRLTAWGVTGMTGTALVVPTTPVLLMIAIWTGVTQWWMTGLVVAVTGALIVLAALDNEWSREVRR